MLGLALFPSSFSSSSSSFPPPTQQTTAASCVLSSLHLLFSQHLERSRSPHSDLGLTALTHQHWLVWSLPSVLQEGTRTEQPGEAAGSWGLGAPSEESPSRMRCFPVGFFFGSHRPLLRVCPSTQLSLLRWPWLHSRPSRGPSAPPLPVARGPADGGAETGQSDATSSEHGWRRRRALFWDW